MDNLHFILNNILTKFFKKLTKYKNDYQQYLNYIYMNYIIHFIVYLQGVFMHMHEVTSQFRSKLCKVHGIIDDLSLQLKS